MNERSPEPGSATVAPSTERLPPPAMAKSWPADLLSGFLVFLIALPLCLAISLASGYPAIAGVYTAIIGGILTTFISNSELTIKGPAAGLIVIAIGAITAFEGGVGKTPEQNWQAYEMALAVGVVAGVIQLAFGLLRLGDIIGDFFPRAAVHGMLASIGVVIAVKQIHIALGVQDVSGGAFTQMAALPATFARLNPYPAVIGVTSLLILFGLPMIRNRYARMIPAPMIVLVVSVVLGLAFDLHNEHNYRLGNRTYVIGPKYEVNLPTSMFERLPSPNWRALTETTPVMVSAEGEPAVYGPSLAWRGWKYVLLFVFVGSLESLLSAKAVDLIDPWRRKANLNRDLTAIGVANTAAAFVGGLPMISEIVRSRANIDNGARTRLADLFHALFLLVCVATIPGILNQIPLAALAAMLVYTGYRLASPHEFVNTYLVGPEQLVIFLTTLLVSLWTDLLIGIAAGVAMKFVIHLINGAPLGAMLKPTISVESRDASTSVIKVEQAAVFTNWLWLKNRLDKVSSTQNVVLDLSGTRLVDHTVMEKLHELESEYEHAGRKLTVVGLEDHRPLSGHPQAARKKGAKTR